MNFKNHFEKIKKYATPSNLILLLIFGSLFYVLRFSLVDKLIVTGDTPGHYYLCEKMLEYLQQFHISGYDYNWFNGFPVFLFYNQLPYITVCFLHLISFKAISLTLSFNLVSFSLPFLFLISVYYTTNALFRDKKINIISVCIAYLILLSSTAYNFGIGIIGQYLNGFFSNCFTWPLFIFFIGVIEKLKQTSKRKYLLIAILLFSGIILSHIFVTIFVGIYLAFFLMFHWKTMWKKVLIIIFGSAMITALWWIPFILNIQYSSGDNTSGTLMGDPIIALYSQSILGIFLLISSIFGIIRLLSEKKYILPATFLICLIFLPREIINQLIELPIHFYRAVGMLVIINIFISAYGLKYLLDNYYQLNGKHFILKSIIFWIFFIGLQTAVEPQLESKYFYNNIYFDNQENKESINEIINIVKNDEGGVFYDTYITGSYAGGHYIDKELASNGKKVLGGLLYQSALSANYFFIDEMLFDYGYFSSAILTPYYMKSLTGKAYYPFKNMELDNLIGLTDKKSADMIKISLDNLSNYGIKYVLTNNIHRTPIFDFVESPLNNGLVSIKKISTPFVLLEINQDYRKDFSSVDYKPFLYIKDGLFSQDFKSFSKQWYQSGYANNYPIIYTAENNDIPENEYGKIGGYIISTNSCPEDKIKYFANKGTPVIVINANEKCSSEEKNVFFINKKRDSDSNIKTRDEEDIELEEKNKLYKKVYEIVSSLSDKAKYDKIDGTIEGYKLKFNSASGVLINYSYFPKWKSSDKNQTVFWITPSNMFVFGKGNNELTYK
ncbi:MAG: hypothetical protein WCX74_00955 [Candidatus Paceibacterota bacterium]